MGSVSNSTSTSSASRVCLYSTTRPIATSGEHTSWVTSLRPGACAQMKTGFCRW